MNLHSPPYIDSTRFTVKDEKLTIIQPESRVTLRCASVTKPLYMWAANDLIFLDEQTTWLNLAKNAITTSSNEATSEVWRECSGTKLLSTLNNHTGNSWSIDQNNPSWGSVRITAYSLAKGYGHLLLQSPYEKSASTVLNFMTQIEAKQTFGIRTAIKHNFPHKIGTLYLKCGWYIDEDDNRIRTHAIVIAQPSNREYVGAAVLTSLPYSDLKINQYKKLYDSGSEVINLHEATSGDILRNKVIELLRVSIDGITSTETPSKVRL